MIKARRTYTFETPTTFAAQDGFAQTAGALNGKTLPAGGTWATSQLGSGSGDFSVETTENTIVRTAVSDGDGGAGGPVGRLALAGTDTYTSVGLQWDFRYNVTTSNGPALGVELVTSYVDSSNMATVRIEPGLPVVGGDSIYHGMSLRRHVGGTTTWPVEAVGMRPDHAADKWFTARVVRYANGRVFVWFGLTGQTLPLVLDGYDSALATGGALATGRVGVLENKIGTQGATSRNYDNFSAWLPTEDAACFANQSLEIRSYGDDPALREDSSGTYWGRPGEVRGGRMWLPPAGDQNRVTRIAVMARRNDIETMPSAHTDSISVTCHYRPRFLVIPRQP